MIVNVCPAGIANVEPDRVWPLLTIPERYDEWVDGRFVSATPPGPAARGQRIALSTMAFARRWPVTIDVGDIDPDRRWIDLTVHLPLGLVNREHVTLTPTDRGTLVRLN